MVKIDCLFPDRLMNFYFAENLKLKIFLTFVVGLLVGIFSIVVFTPTEKAVNRGSAIEPNESGIIKARLIEDETSAEFASNILRVERGTEVTARVWEFEGAYLFGFTVVEPSSGQEKKVKPFILPSSKPLEDVVNVKGKLIVYWNSAPPKKLSEETKSDKEQLLSFRIVGRSEVISMDGNRVFSSSGPLAKGAWRIIDPSESSSSSSIDYSMYLGNRDGDRPLSNPNLHLVLVGANQIDWDNLEPCLNKLANEQLARFNGTEER